jgi:hypothetical protein
MGPGMLRIILVAWLLLTASPSWAEALASVDRTEVTIDESFSLILTVSELRVFSQPDLTPLEADFHVLGTSQSSNTSIVNGKLTSSTRWTVQLMPKRPGKTSIPPIKIGKEKTHTIEIAVNGQGQGSTATNDDSIVLEAELSENTAYVTAQVILTIRVSMAQSSRFQLEEPKLEDAMVQQISEASFQQIRGGRRFQVTEYAFAIFPSVTGELVIRPVNLVAEIMANRPRSMFDPMLGQSKRVLRRTEPLTLNVIPAPDGIAAANWLPASDVSLTEQWSSNIQQLAVGDSITRSIELKARGVMASQLPPLFLPNVDGLKLYPDQPTASDDQNANGITGKRAERIAIVATKPGSYTLPEQRVQWWDVNSNEARTATLPAISFEVATSATSPAQPVIQDNTISEPSSPAITTVLPQPPARAWYQYRQWWWITMLLVLVCLALALLYLRARRQIQPSEAVPNASETAPRIDSEAQAYQQLRTACGSSDVRKSYDALQNWCRQYWDISIVPAFEELSSTGASERLVAHAIELQQRLYGQEQQSDTPWDSAELLQAVVEQRHHQRKASTEQQGLPPLYRE